ncbi:hypothetical protein BKA64DRAFT_646032 [Cadophora sp. MPI-SDFR-AT-0126]|nr:hypothetical protein BKA64DRAFT_646032 [Leotiomycetes sp. MPI-SDFR-AT-0126]
MATPYCCVCGKPSTKQCSTCSSADYCSSRCESRDLPSHQLLCRDFLDFTSSNPKPSTNCVLALYFPSLPFLTRGRAPDFIWFDGKNKVTRNPTTGTITYTNCLSDGSHVDPEAKGFEIFANYVKRFPLRHTVILHMRHAFRFDGSRVNVSLLETTKGELSTPWGGPLVVYCRNGLSMDSDRVDRDFTLSDFRTFLDFCKGYGAGPGSMLKENMLFELEVTNANLFRSVLNRYSGGTAAKGVEISCKGDMMVLGFRKYRVSDVAVNHPIWDTFHIPSEPTAASRMIQVPLRIRRIYPDRRFAGKGFDMMDNEEARYLDIVTDEVDPCWGMPDSGYTDEFGTGKMFGRVLVVRQDSKDVTPKQVQAVVKFFSQEVSHKINMEGKDRLSKLSVEEALIERRKIMAEVISRAIFEIFFESFKIDKINGGDTSWVNETVPEATEGESDDESLTHVSSRLGELSVSGLGASCS